MQVKCSICGRTFDSEDQSAPGQINNKWFCSDVCADKEFKKTCLFCKKEFYTLDGDFAWYKRGYCSDSCCKKADDAKALAAKQAAEAKAAAEKKAAEDKARAEKAAAEAAEKAKREAEAAAKLNEERKKGTKITCTAPTLTVSDSKIILQFPKITNSSNFNSQKLIAVVYVTDSKDTDYKTIDIKDKKKVTQYGTPTTVMDSLGANKYYENLNITITKGNTTLYDGQHYAFVILYEVNYPDTTVMHEIGRWGMLSCFTRDSFYSTQRYIQQKKQKRKSIIQKSAIGFVAAIALLLGVAKCKSCSSEKNPETTVKTTDTKNQNVTYVPLPQGSTVSFNCESVSVSFNPKKQTGNATLNKLYHNGKGNSGSFQFALYLLPEQFKKDDTLTNRISSADLSVQGLQQNYGWEKRDITYTVSNKSPAKGTYYLMGAVCYFDKDSVWRYDCNALFDFGKIEWNPGSDKDYSFNWRKSGGAAATTSSSSSASSNTKNTSTQNKVEYVKGSLDYSWDDKFKMEGISANWDYNTKTVTFKAKELRNISSHPTGSLKLALFMLDKPYENKTALTGKVAEVVISTPALKPNYGWENQEWTANFLSNVPSAGDKYPVIAVLEYTTDSSNTTNWFKCGNNFVIYGKVSWQPAK